MISLFLPRPTSAAGDQAGTALRFAGSRGDVARLPLGNLNVLIRRPGDDARRRITDVLSR
jgi:hypothetical protein